MLVRKAQIWLILHLWEIIPIRVKVTTLHKDGSIRSSLWWIRKNITKFHSEQEAFITDKDSLFFEVKWLLLISPILIYSESRAFPLRSRELGS